MHGCRALLIDIDGTVVEGLGGGAYEGAAAAWSRIRERMPALFVTNATSRTRAALVEDLRREGFDLADDEVVNPPVLARRVLTERGQAQGLLLADDPVPEDLSWFEEVPAENARTVLLATEGHHLSIGALGPAVEALRRGAALYTLQQNRVFQRGERLLTDLGPVAAFLGYAAEATWENFGKPSPLLFSGLAARLGVAVRELAMVGDDAEFDASGALRAGAGAGVLVRTGKYRDGDEARVTPRPSLVLDRFSDLPRVFGF